MSCFADCTKHASAGALIHGQQTIHGIFTHTKISSIYTHKLYCHLLGFDKTSSFAYNLGESQTCNYYHFLLFGRDRVCEILASVWQEEGNFEVLKLCHIQIYLTSFFSCGLEKLLLFNICET